MTAPIGIAGLGTIGAGWAMRFLAYGQPVYLYDTNAAEVDAFFRTLESAWPVMQSMGLATVPYADRWKIAQHAEELAENCEFIQESVSENHEVKVELFRRMEDVLQPSSVVASSTSTLAMGDLQADLKHPEHFIVGHPLNSPHLIDIVEVVMGAKTSTATRDRADEIYQAIGMKVLNLSKEGAGMITARLISAVFRESLALVSEGVASVEQVDVAMRDGIARRWAVVGPFLTFHLGAGTSGIRGYLNHLGPAHEYLWSQLSTMTKIDPDLADSVANGVDSYTGSADVAELIHQRDEKLALLAKALDR